MWYGAGMSPAAHRAAGRRAAPLAPGARRSALVSATLPLLRRRGFDVSTRQIALAAGVAEGTIFRAFPDKDSLIRAAILAAFDPAPVVSALDGIDRGAPLAQRLIVAVRIVQVWLTGVIGLMTALHASHRPGAKPHFRRPHPSELVGAALARLIEPDRALLRVPAPQAARLLRLLLFAGSHPMITDGPLLSPAEIVSVILEGIRVHSVPTRQESPAC